MSGQTPGTGLKNHGVKARMTGEKSWAFVGSGGKLNRLRIHALRMDEATAKEMAADIPTDNPGWEAKVVAFA